MATIIDLATAKSLIQEYQLQNASAGGPGLITPAKQFLNGYFVDRQSLEALLSNPNVIGISFDLAKDPAFVALPENVFTLVYAGAQINPDPSPQATPYINTGDIYSGTPPCPTFCITLG
jgi:hypothetical protein